MVQRTNVRLGKRAPRIDPRTLVLKDYLRNPLHKDKAPIPAPVADGYIIKVGSWPMYENDQLGDCVAAAAGHSVEQWTTYAGDVYVPTNAEVLKFYESQGYILGEPQTDNGMSMLLALNYWRKTGLGKHKIAGYVSIDPTNHAEVAQAIYLFGNVFTGLALPLSAQSGIFQVPSEGPVGDGSPGSWGGHCVPIVGYNDKTVGTHPAGLMCITWGGLMPITWNFIDAYCDEMYAVLSADWISSNGVSVDNLNLGQLTVDLKTVSE